MRKLYTDIIPIMRGGNATGGHTTPRGVRAATAAHGRGWLLAAMLLLLGVGQGWANSTTYYAKLTATTSATGKGLVYASTANTAPTADSQYKTSMTTGNGSASSSGSSATVTFYAWAKPARGYLFSSWSGNGASSSAKTGSGDAVTISASSSNTNSPTTGTITANWSDATAYTITYKQPENKGQYSVRYDYTTIANNALTSGSESYTMTTSTADQAVKSYAADQVTLSTSLSSFIAWVDGDGNQLSTDKEYTFNPSKAMTITATFTAPKEYQASVTSNGNTTQYKTIQEALAAANKLTTTPTVTLLDNITGVDEILTISKSMTLDLAGYTLSGAGGRRAPSSTSDLSMTLFAINTKGITVTIKDSSTAKTGTISCTDELNHDLYTIRMDQGTLNLESGTIHCENPMKYVTDKTRMRCYAVYAAPGTTINQTGATIEAVADYYSYGILTGGWYSGNGPAKVNVSGGKIVATAYNVPTGINLGYGTLNVTGGTIEADGTGGTWSSYGITVNAGANAQKKNEWKGTLTMSGGTVKATSTTSGARGIRVNRSVAFVNNTQEVGSIVNGEATITGGTITAETTTSWPVAVEPYGDCTISGGTITANATTTDAYGVRVVDGTTYIKDGANITATAKTGTAIGVASIADTDGSKGTAYEGDLHVEGGTITAKVTSGSNARGIAVYSTTRTITSTKTGYYVGVYAAAGKATISGGKVSATASGSGANGLYVAATGTLTNATYGTASATPTATVTGGWFIASGTNAASVNSNASTTALVITGGDYQQNTNLATYIPDTKTVYQITGSIHVDAYNFGCRYYVSDWDNTKAIAKNTSTGTTYTTLNAALDAATSGQTVVLTENYRMEEQATVKNGVTLLIPYNSSYTSLTTKPTVTQTWTALSAYKTLYMAEGSSITVNNGGAICVAGQMFSTSNRMSTSAGGPGTPTGAFGCISMKNGGKITLESGAKLYAWGFITGQNKDEGNNTTGVGTIDAQNGAVVYEDFVIGDWHGGNATSNFSSEKKFFPFNQYFIPNIEVPMTINYGATLNTYCNISAGWGSSKSPYDIPVNNFIATSEGLFNTTSEGSSIKTWYDATTDYENFEFKGDVSIGSLSINLAGYVTVDSKSYVLPLTSSMYMHILGTLTASNDMALLPCSRVSVEEGATANISSNVYVYDLDNWDGYAYSYQRINYPFRPTAHYNPTSTWTAKTGMTDAKLIVNGTLNMSGSLYTTAAGADICGTGESGKIVFTKAPTATATTYQVKDLSTETGVNVTAAQLHNDVTKKDLWTVSDEYTKTAGASAGTTYYYNIDRGQWQTSEPVLAPTFSLADGTTYYEGQTLELANRTDGATIKYSTDGGATWTDYSKAIAITATTTVKAKSVKNGTESAIASATYTIDTSKLPAYTYSAATGAFALTNQGIVTEANLTAALASTVKTGTLLSVDLTPGTCDIDAATLRTLIYNTLGGTVGSNFLLYINEATAEKATAETAKNVVVKGSDGTYTAGSFVVADKEPLCVPRAFTATAASYSRTNTTYDGTLQWGTICLPFALTSGDGIQYYQLAGIKDNQMTFTALSSVAANMPAVYSVKSGSAITISGSNVTVEATQSNDVGSGSFTLYGVQAGSVTLTHGTSYYYISHNKFWQPTKNDVTIRPQRAYFGGTAAAKVFSIGVDDGTTVIGGPSVGEATMTGIYSVNGMRQGELRKGVNIVRFSDGTTRKVVIK